MQRDRGDGLQLPILLLPLACACLQKYVLLSINSYFEVARKQMHFNITKFGLCREPLHITSENCGFFFCSSSFFVSGYELLWARYRDMTPFMEK